MFFFALAVFAASLWFLPWWCLNLLAFLMGGALRMPRADGIALAGALASAALTFIKDGQSSGMISQRMSALFHLPAWWMIFLVMGILGGVSSWLSYWGGLKLAEAVLIKGDIVT